MTGALQNHARHSQIPIDRLNFGFKILDLTSPSALHAPPLEGMYVHGLYLESAYWDTKEGYVLRSWGGGGGAGAEQ